MTPFHVRRALQLGISSVNLKRNCDDYTPHNYIANFPLLIAVGHLGVVA